MHEIPVDIYTDLDDLRGELRAADIVVFDFETSGVKPTRAAVAGIGFYFPKSRRTFYINCGHAVRDADFPRYPVEKVAKCIGPFFRNKKKLAVAHNATFDVRMLYRMGVEVQCQIACTMILTHRLDENLRSFGSGRTIHYHSRVSYGLKELTTIFFRVKPPKLHEVSENRNTTHSPPRLIADYCRIDCVNTFNLFDRFRRVLGFGDPVTTPASVLNTRMMLKPVGRLSEQIDNPNNVVLARMMWEGIRIDSAEATRQYALYTDSIQACRNRIWKILGINPALETPKDVLKVMRSLGVDSELGYDPFDTPPESLKNWGVSVAGEVLIDVFDGIEDVSNREVVALLLSMSLMKQRLSAFILPLSGKVMYSGERLHPDRFDSTLVTTRFSCSPNLQNMPGRADKAEAWQACLPANCREYSKTRNLFVAKPGSLLVSIDLKAAEPRYMALLFQKALRIQSQEFSEAKRRKRKALMARYPDLMDAMVRLQKGSATQPFQIEWPDISDDPLWTVFKYGVPTDDPYNALLIAMDAAGYQQAVAIGTEKQWFKDNRNYGKKAFLAFAYGASAEALAPQLGWSLVRTRQAIASIEGSYPTLIPLRQLTMMQLTHFGEVTSLWGRPRRINGYYQLAQGEPVTVCFRLQKPTPRSYIAKIIPLGSTSPVLSAGGNIAGGMVQAFVEECYIELDGGDRGEVVLRGNPDGSVGYAAKYDPFVTAENFNNLPFRNIGYNQIQWVEDKDGLKRIFPKQGSASRMAFNSLCQSTGADHLRWIMNAVDREVCLKPMFRDCKLVLTIHDSLVYEVPEGLLDKFVAKARKIACRRPKWSDIEFLVEVEAGKKFGEMKEVV